eukprot:COSAG06_NODE_5179_length_3656_cov_3.704245_2_plen_51_part_00
MKQTQNDNLTSDPPSIRIVPASNIDIVTFLWPLATTRDHRYSSIPKVVYV